MTRGQIAQLQELSKCYIEPGAAAFVYYMIAWEYMLDKRINKKAGLFIRRLTHQYRHQIKAMKRNRK